MNNLTKLIKDEMKPALGVTEPGAIAYAAAKAREYTEGDIQSISISLNSGIYKNAFTCGIPNSTQVGNKFAAALGAIAGDASKGLEVLEDVTKEDNGNAKKLIDEGKVTVKLHEISSEIYISAEVRTQDYTAAVTIDDASHTNISKITVNGKEKYKNKKGESEDRSNSRNEALIHKYTLGQLLDYAKTIDISEISFIEEAYEVNYELFKESLDNPGCIFAKQLLEINGGSIISENEQTTASLLCNATIEARVLGLDKPAMIISGSGVHGIMATMPLLASYRVNKYRDEKLIRATALSYLICMYIKEYSGKLSALCGCALAAGTGMACGLVYLKDGSLDMVKHTINNMASSITGMICDGGNQGCIMKGITTVDTAYKAADFAINGIYIDDIHGINATTAEETMRNMGLISAPGMTKTEETIIDILKSKK
ncbi:MAG: serine dehydratase subunit alpha family protein [Suipraeoptans sp.]